MSNDDYQVAYERATSEISAINALLTKLIRRKELLEEVIAPLQRLAASGDSPIPASAGSNASDSGSQEETPDEHAFAFAIPKNAPDEVGHGANGASAVSDATEGLDGGVAELAYRFWIERGGIHGQHEQDWLRAEGELQQPGQ